MSENNKNINSESKSEIKKEEKIFDTKTIVSWILIIILILMILFFYFIDLSPKESDVVEEKKTLTREELNSITEELGRNSEPKLTKEELEDITNKMSEDNQAPKISAEDLEKITNNLAN